ncbi:aconitate hydratase [Lysinibacillus sp. NPDC097214]|uniref:aconitate hydratase n=1 Tax=Lysinibacillus sp. NPDC097214 TaxID=3390584 RepID=UPI003D016CDD
MIKFEQQRLLHKFVILDLAIQSLQRDFSVIENLKMCNVYIAMIEKLLKAITRDHYNIKRDLAKDKIKIVRWEKISEHFSDLTVTTPGQDQVLRYANQTVKKRVEELLLSHINKGTD